MNRLFFTGKIKSTLLNTCVKYKTGTILRKSLNMLDRNDLSRDILPTTRQKTKLRNAFTEISPVT